MSLHQNLTNLYTQQCLAQVVPPTVPHVLSTMITCRNPQNPTQHIRIQYNPDRANRGISQLVNPNPAHTIPYKEGIPCFCCLDTIHYQWPNERYITAKIHQKDLIFLPNVSPIFDHHFTVVTPEHSQQVTDIPTLTTLSNALPGYWIIQNGEGAGATNPWHFHFQAFKDTIPLATYPALSEHPLTQIDHPATIYRYTTIAPMHTDHQQDLQTLIQKFEDLDPDNRINLLGFTTKKVTTLFLVLRNRRQRTSLYKTGQPGYAEGAGVITSIAPDTFESWKTDGWARYTRLMSDIRLQDDIHQEFKELVNRSLTPPNRP